MKRDLRHLLKRLIFPLLPPNEKSFVPDANYMYVDWTTDCSENEDCSENTTLFLSFPFLYS